VAKIEPIVGKYIWVTYEGTEYRMYFEEAGNPNGIPMVCLHTAGTDGREWRHQLCDERIGKNFRTIAIDLPRHGKSIPPYDWYKESEEYKLTAKYYAGIVMAFCKALELDKPVIMGSSMGGNICMHLARDHEDSVLNCAPGRRPGWSARMQTCSRRRVTGLQRVSFWTSFTGLRIFPSVMLNWPASFRHW